MGSMFAKTYGLENRINGPAYYLSANAEVRISDWLTLPFSFTLGKHGGNLNYPAFLRMGASPKYKNFQFHLGYRSMKLSDFTLNDQTFTGIGLEWNNSWLRLAGMYGRLRNAREFQDDSDFGRLPAVYKRNGFGGKVGFGTDKNHVDIVFFRAKDDSSSVSNLGVDSIITPGENLTVGLVSNFSIFKNTNLFGEVATSVFTRDVRSSSYDENEEYVPNEVYDYRFSSRLSLAWKVGVKTNFKSLGIGVHVENVDPNYETMGAYFFENDVRRYLTNINYSTLEGRLNIFGQAGIQTNDNLDTRSVRTRRFVGNGNISFQSRSSFGIDFGYTNVNIGQDEIQNKFIDSVRLKTVTTHYVLTPRWTWIQDTSSSTTFLVSSFYQQLNDRNPFTREFSQINTYGVNATYSKSNFISHYSYNLGFNAYQVSVQDITVLSTGVTVGYNKAWKQDKFTLSPSLTYNSNIQAGEFEGHTIRSEVGMTYQFYKKHSLTFNMSLILYELKSFDDYQEILGQINYSTRF